MINSGDGDVAVEQIYEIKGGREKPVTIQRKVQEKNIVRALDRI